MSPSQLRRQSSQQSEKYGRTTWSKIWNPCMNETWDLVELPRGRNLVDIKWVFKKKMNVTGEVDKFKGRLVAKVYSQVDGVKFGDIFSSIAKLTSIRVLMSMAATFYLEVE
jgi:hypothetical protein